MYALFLSLTLDEIAAAAELILAQDVAEAKEGTSWSESSDEGFGEVESDLDDEHMEAELSKSGDDVETLGDSGYGENSSHPMETRYSR